MMNRRQFLATSALAVAAHAVPARWSWPQDDPFTLLRRGVGTFEGRGGTIGWLVSDEALVVVDSQFPESATTCWQGLRERSTRPIDVLLNTHHHGDHTAGNGVFAPHAGQIVAHAQCKAWQQKSAEQRGNTADQVFATMTFETEWQADVGDETIHATYHGRAHTSGDAVIHFQRADVVHMGDLVFNRRPPYIDRGAGASIELWGNMLEEVHNRFTDETIFIFGHSNSGYDITGTRADLLAMRDFLHGLLEFVHTGIQAGKSEEELARVEVLPNFPAYTIAGRPQSLQRCIRTAYAEATEG